MKASAAYSADRPLLNPTAIFPPEPQACEELFCAIIGLAVKDLRHVEFLQDKASLTGYERKKLLLLTEVDHPGEFLESAWFEQICGMLNLHPDTIRVGLHSRDIEFDG